MKHNQFLSLALAAALLLAGCGASSSAASGETDSETAATPAPTQAPAGSAADTATDAETADTADGSHILIAYFTAANNSGVDVVASASVSTIDGVPMGRVEAIARMIQDDTGGDLFSIQTSVVYPADGGELIDYAAEEQDQNARPELTSQVENFDQYDVVFVGYPNWWADLPMVMYSFFDGYDFAGKTIIPFNVHNGSRFSRTIETIQELEPEATVITDGFTVNENDVPEAAADVAAWVQELGY